MSGFSRISGRTTVSSHASGLNLLDADGDPRLVRVEIPGGIVRDGAGEGTFFFLAPARPELHGDVRHQYATPQ